MENKTEQKKKYEVLVVGFGEQSIPKFTENKSSKIVTYGEKDNYPEYLLDKFNRSPKHGAIVKGKAHYIAGNGFQIDEEKRKKLEKINRYNESWDSIAKKVALDVEIHGGAFLQIIYSNGGGIADILHLDYHKVRSNKDNTQFFIRDEKGKYDPKKPIAAFDSEKPTGTQILYYKEYFPGIDTYTLPSYVQALSYIESDINVADHTLNNSVSGFTGSKMIVFTDGEPETEEEKKAIERAITDKFTGRKGSKLVISFSNGKDQVPVIQDLGASDLTKEDFSKVDELISQNVYASHGVTSPMLFGIMTEGKLGMSTELQESFEIFKNTYVNAKQKNLEEVFETLFELKGVKPMKLAAVEPIGLIFSETVIAANLTRDEIRERIGAPKEEPTVKTEAQQMLDALNSLSPLIATKVVDALGKERLLALIGVKATPEELKPVATPNNDPNADPNNDPNNANQQQFSADDENLLAEFMTVGDPREDFILLKKKKSFFSEQGTPESEEEILQAFGQELNANQTKILDLIRKDARISNDNISQALKLPRPYVAKVVSDLVTQGLIKVGTEKTTDGKQVVRQIVEEKVAKIETRKLDKQIYVKYSYEGPYDDKNRPFCSRLMELDKLYSRADIEQISERVGYSVWERRGGFYHNPNTGKTTPYCRHAWQQQIVIKKKNS